MTSSHTSSEDLLNHVLLPVADESDAAATAAALEPYSPNRVTALHVVEKGGGVPDKTPVEQSEQIADDSCAAIRERFPDAEKQTAYGTDVVEQIFETAEEVDASAVVYQSRGGNRIVRFLSGDRSLRLVTEAEIPVVALPRVDAGDESDQSEDEE